MEQSQRANRRWPGARTGLLIGGVALATGLGFFMLLPTVSGQEATDRQPGVKQNSPINEPTPRQAKESGAPAPVGIAVNTAPAPAPNASAQNVPDNAKAEPTFQPVHRTLEEGLRRTQERQELRSRFEKEKKLDTHWSESLAERLTNDLTENQVGEPAAVDTDCRETICRVMLRSRSRTKQEVMGVIHVARALHPETWLVAEDAEDGTFEVELFLPRDGYRLSGGGGRIDATE